MLNILFASSEALPYAASGGLADVAGSLPKALTAAGCDCRVVLPYYKKKVPKALQDSIAFITHFTVDVSWRKQYCGVFQAESDGVIYYLIDNEFYFNRDGLYGYYDDAERFTFFSRAVLEMLPHLNGFRPQVIHSNDWQTAMVPVMYDVFYRYREGYEDIKTVFTIHNIQYQGQYGMDVLGDVLGIPMYHTALLQYDGCINLMKGAVEVADKITTVSPSYAWEILDPWYSHGLDRALRGKQYKLCGFLNGIDTVNYNPETDPIIPANYTAEDHKGKQICKQKLLEELGLQEDGGEPLMGIVTRFVSHKGIDLIKYVFTDLVELGYKFAILGAGDRVYEEFFTEMADRYPGQVSVTLGFIPDLSRRIYAAADMFLMPSQSEPCGLAQMISVRYGTIPIVRETGGLRDSISDAGGKDGNGFTFKTYNAHDMLHACERAKAYYDKKAKWDKLVTHAMQQDFSWAKSAELYMGLYRELTGEKALTPGVKE